MAAGYAKETSEGEMTYTPEQLRKDADASERDGSLKYAAEQRHHAAALEKLKIAEEALESLLSAVDAVNGNSVGVVVDPHSTAEARAALAAIRKSHD